MFLDSSVSSHEIMDMGFHVPIIGYAQGNNIPQCLSKCDIACRMKSVTSGTPNLSQIIIIFYNHHQSSGDHGNRDRVGLCSLYFPCFEVCLVIALVLITCLSLRLIWFGLAFDGDIKNLLVVKDGMNLCRPRMIILFVETLDLDGEWLLTVAGHGWIV